MSKNSARSVARLRLTPPTSTEWPELLVRTGGAPARGDDVARAGGAPQPPELDATFPEVHDFYDYYAQVCKRRGTVRRCSSSATVSNSVPADRNGLRPARFWRTSDDYIYVASEVGVLGDVLSNASNVVSKAVLVRA